MLRVSAGRPSVANECRGTSYSHAAACPGIAGAAQIVNHLKPASNLVLEVGGVDGKIVRLWTRRFRVALSPLFRLLHEGEHVPDAQPPGFLLFSEPVSVRGRRQNAARTIAMRSTFLHRSPMMLFIPCS